jgi:hypothetical protein
MISYIEQIQIFKAKDKSTLVKQVKDFSVGKCIKKVQYYSHNINGEVVENYEVYIYFTEPELPVFELTVTPLTLEAVLKMYIESPIWINLIEVGVQYNYTGTFTRFDEKIIFPNKYGSNSILQTFTQQTVYVRPYIETCLGVSYGDIQEITLVDSLIDTYEELIYDTYNDVLVSTY